MDRQDDDSEDALMESHNPLCRPDPVRHGVVSVVVWGFVLVGFVIAIAMFTNHVLGWVIRHNREWR